MPELRRSECLNTRREDHHISYLEPKSILWSSQDRGERGAPWMIMTDDLQRERAQRQKDAQRLIAWLIIVAAYCGSFVGLVIYLTG